MNEVETSCQPAARCRFRATTEFFLITKKTYRLTIIGEREEIPSNPPDLFTGCRGLLVASHDRAFFYWGHG